LAWLIALGAIFYLSYGFANWVTGLRRDVPEIAFGWERSVPFLPWTIVPYWSTNLFYAAALFLCGSRAEVRTLARRLLAAQAICIAGFLLFPLRFDFAHPGVTGFFGAMFDALLSFDRPFNQAPSLHVAITAVLWAAYSRHVRGPLLWLIRAWLILAALSTLTTYQHHFIDLPTGLAAGLLAIAWLPYMRDRASADARHLRLAAAYTAGAALFCIQPLLFGEAGLILLWPAASLSIVAAAYFAANPGVLRKSHGALPLWLRVFLAPYTVCAWLSSRRHTLARPDANEIADGVWLGRFPSRADRAPFASFVDMTAEFSFDAAPPTYRSIPLLDMLAPAPDRLARAAQAIVGLRDARPTLVFCALGYSRSAAAVAAWLFAEGRAASVKEAVGFVRARRPVIVLRRAHIEALEQFAAGRMPR
jgi:protein-tyrosine phosphatase